MKGRILLGLAALVICFFLAGCEYEPKDKLYTNSEFSITMEEDMTNEENSFNYENINVKMNAIKNSFESYKDSEVKLTKDNTIIDYAGTILNSLGTDYELILQDNLSFYKCEEKENNKTYFHFVSYYKSDDAFWSFNFSCEAKDKDKYLPKFKEWAKTVKFN